MAKHYFPADEFTADTINAMREEGHSVKTWNKAPDGTQWYVAEDAPTLQAVDIVAQLSAEPFDPEAEDDEPFEVQAAADPEAVTTYFDLIDSIADGTLPDGFLNCHGEQILAEAGVSYEAFAEDLQKTLAERSRAELRSFVEFIADERQPRGFF